MKSHVKFRFFVWGVTGALSLIFLIYPRSLSPKTGSYSLSLDLDSSAGDQAASSLDASPNDVITIQIFGRDLQNADRFSALFEYDATQVVCEKFDVGDVFPNPLVELDSITVVQHNETSVLQVDITSSGKSKTANDNLIGTLRFRTTDAFSSTEIQLARAGLGREGQFETATTPISVALQIPAAPSPDFDGNGTVDFPDFLAFVSVFGTQAGQYKYDAKYDLNRDGKIAFEDFEILTHSFGRTVVARKPPTPPKLPKISPQSTPASSPDLILESPAVSDSILDPGARFTLSVTVRNQGAATTPSLMRMDHYLSTDDTISTGDTQVGWDLVGLLAASETSDESVQLRAPSNGGTYYYGACIEAGSGESDTGNNCSSAVTLTVGTSSTSPAPNRTDNPKGIWSDGTTMWVADDAQGMVGVEDNDKIYAYDLATRARDPSKDFNTLNAAGNDDPEGIWSDGTTMWVADQSDEKLYAYDMTSRERVPTRDFNTLDAAGNDEPTGIWSDGTTMWVADDAQGEWFAEDNDKIYAYVLTTRARDPSKDFNTLNAAGNDDPEGIWSDGTTMWVADQSDEMLYAYDMTSGNRVPGRDFNTLDAAGNDEPTGIWSDGTTMWVADQSDEKLYAYDMTSGSRVPSRDFNSRDAAPPDRPDAPTITATTLNSLSIRWTAPANSGSAISDYDVQYRAQGGSFTDWPHTGTGTTTTITGLTANTRYEIQVRATNEEGTGDWSASGSGTTGSSGTGGGSDDNPDLIVETPQPLTEPTLSGSVVTLTLTGAVYERSIFDIRDNVEVSGVAGVSVGTFGIRRVSDTVVTVELTFNGNLDTDGTLTFTARAGAIANYSGAALTGTLSVTAVEESVVASTPRPLTEATLNGSVVTLTLTGAAYERSIFDIQDNVEVSGVAGVSVGRFGIRRVSDTVVTVTLAFSGNLDTDGTLTFTVRADAIASYNGAALTGTLPVTAHLDAAAPGRPDAPTITATTLNSLSIRWTAPANSGSAISDYDVQYRAQGGSFTDWPHTGTGTTTTITGLAANTRYEVQVRATNEEGTGDWSASGSGTTGSSGTGGGGDGSPNLIVETPQPLTEPTLNGSVVTLTLTGAAYERSIFDIRDNVEVSGVAGVSVGTFGIRRVSDTVVTVELTFNGNLDTDGTLTFTVRAGAIANYSGAALTGTLSVTAVEESVVASTPRPLTEATLNGSVVTLTLTGAAYERSIFDIQDNVEVSGVAGVSVGRFGIRRVSDTVVTVTLAFSGNLDTDGTLTFTVRADAIASYNGAALTGTLPVTAVEESLVASTPRPLTEATLNGSVVTLTLTGAAYEPFVFNIRDNVEVSGVAGVSVGRFGIRRVSDTVVTVTLAFSGNLDTDGTLTFTVRAGAIANYSGPAFTGTLPVTAGSGSGPNQAPTFSEGASTARSLAENTGAGQNIGNPISARDDDGDRLTYSLEGRDAAAFTIISGSGQLRTRSGVRYDYETKSSYSVTVRAQDGKGGSATIAVTVTLTDENEPPDRPDAPVVTASTLNSLSIRWTAPTNPGSAISDYDVQYKEAGGSFADWPHSGTGTTTTITGLTPNTRYEIQVRATNARGISPWSPSVTGTTTDNQSPAFSEGTSASRSLAENTGAGRNVGNPVSATDSDGDRLTYSLEGRDASAFTVQSDNGQLMTGSGETYDYETKHSYSVTVRAQDGKGGSATIAVTIFLTDESEPPGRPIAPTVTASSNSLSMRWTAPANSGPAISGYDVQYRAAGGSFTDWPHTGASTTTAITGLTANTRYEVQVRATNDEGTGDWSPSGSGTTGSTGTNDPDLIVESPSVDNNILSPEQSFRLSATVRNRGGERSSSTTLRYYLSTDETISTSDTEVGTDYVSRLDAAESSDESVRLRAPSSNGTHYYGACVESVIGESDTGNNCSGAVTVTVLGPDLIVEPPSVDNNAPTPGRRIRLSATVRNQGGGRAPSTTLRYYLSTDETIDQSDTEIDTDYVSSLDPSETSDEREFVSAPSSAGRYYYGACVEAVTGESDAGNNCSGAVIVTVRTTSPPPTTNRPPVFSEGASTTRSMAENTGAGQNIGDPVSATDGDGDRLTYSLQGTDASSFGISAGSGQLMTRSGVSYDYETKNSYSVTVQVQDGEGGSATIAVTVTLTDENEPPERPDAPVVTVSTLNSLSLSWTAPTNPGAPISDYDVQYRETGGNFTDWPHTGTGTTATITGLTANTRYEVQVRATSDEGTGDWSPSVTGTTTDNQSPEFREGTNATRSLAENTGAGRNIGNPVSATDGDGDRLTYSLQGRDASSFIIQSDSGQLMTGSGVTYDYETRDSYSLTVRAEDGEGGSATISLEITLTDENEPPDRPAAPVVTASSNSLSVRWAEPGNTGPVVNDYDVQYRAMGGSFTDWSHIGPGLSTTITGLTPETRYEVQVRATNDEGTSDWSPSGNDTTVRPPPGFAPIDQIAFNTLVRNRVLSVETYYIEFESAGRFEENSAYPGSYTYANTGSNTGILTQNYDGGHLGGTCTIEMTFSSTTSGTLRARCGSEESYDSPQEWRFSDPPDPNAFNIEVIWIGSEPSEGHKTAFDAAVTRWESIITSDVPDVFVSSRDGGTIDGVKVFGLVDDLRIYARLTDIDGPGETLGSAGPREMREQSKLPIVARMTFDTSDLGDFTLEALQDLYLHEMGHCLGIGTVWKSLGLLKDPSIKFEFFIIPVLVDGADTHFAGAGATQAFNDAGGTEYADGKVPVENEKGGLGTRDGHWRQSVFGPNELMEGFLSPGATARGPLSAITIQSLADLGYVVDVGQADAYTLPSAVAAKLAIASEHQIPINCLLTEPIGVIDENRQIELKPKRLNRTHDR